MIESQTEFPAQERGHVAIWAKGRRLSANIATRLREQAQALPGTRGAQYLRDLRSLVGNKAEQIPLRTYLSRLLEWVAAGGRDGSLLNRYALHLVIVFLAIAVVVISQVTIPEVDLVLPEAALAEAEIQPVDTGGVIQVPETNRGVNRLISNEAVLFPAPVLHTTVSERDRMTFITYTVQANDNVWAIAQGFGLKAETVLWANPKVEKSPDLLSVGQKLVIPPVDGIYYTVAQGDTVEKLAKTYKTTVEKIVGFEGNQLEEPYTLAVGQQVMLPDGRKQVVVQTNYYPMTRVGSAPKNALKGSGRFAWPTQGILTQRYWSGHLGIDIANRTGTPIRAADAGYVVMAGRDTWGYGNQVLIDHGNGYLTRYAHLDTIKVKAGESVERNQQIGTMGNTGRSTGPHLHFEIIYSQQRRNPLGFLP
ncbi:MAG: peptidoglycan DD-metalloendopeptidase family protein [Anaerolineae bacterium]